MFLHLVNAAVQKMIIISDPWYFLWVMGNTLWQKQEFFITGTIGELGWLDIPLPSVFYYGIVFILGLIIAKSLKKGKQISLFILFGLTGIVIATLIAISYYFYLYGTAVAYPLVDSLQGRYLLPILPFILLLLVEWVAVALKYKKAAVILTGFTFFVLVGQSIFFRYYDYSRVFDTADALLPLEKDMQNNQKLPLMVIDSTQSFVYDVQYPGYKIGGFQLAVMVDEKKPVNVAYSFELKDVTCAHTIRRGYFDETELHRPHIYTQLIPITPLSTDRMCLVITPLDGAKDMRYLPLVTRDGKPVVNFLYIKK
jgi:Predicted membrane protein (DUF2142)